jgi:hypothetical protein
MFKIRRFQMPYNREKAGKGGHSDFVRNPDIQNFLSSCEYMRPPSDDEARVIASQFSQAPEVNPARLPNFVVASDASKSDTPINDKLPSTQIGFVKVSHVLIAMDRYAELIDPATRFVDPFKAAALHRNAQPVTYVLPGSNIKYRGAATVKEGFRHAVYDQFTVNRREDSSRLVLTETLLLLNNNRLTISKCPSCSSQIDLDFSSQQTIRPCPNCGVNVYATDWLRLHEGISDFGDNTSAMTRMMNAVEHLLLSAFILELLNNSPAALSSIAFIIDGPLALFGEPAKLHNRLMSLIHEANTRMSTLGYEPVLIMGLQKTGNVMDHARLLEKFLPDGVIKVIDDAYRQTYITGSDSVSENFGNETYYGQDFLFKTERGRIFNFALPYPFPDKGSDCGAFAVRKVMLSNYGSLIKRACDLIRYFELDLYDNAFVPIALAHRHASISLVPGGKVLDLIVRAGLAR